jgi:hypothetical protein
MLIVVAISETFSKSIWTTVVILTVVNWLQWWTNPFQSNTFVTRCTYSSSFAIAQNTCGSQFLISTEIAVLYFILWFPHHQIIFLTGQFLV